MEAGAKPSGIAVIITVFNKEKFLRDAIESVLTQHLGASVTNSTTAQHTSCQKTLSIILCDDGSTDSSRQICADYAAKYHSGSDNDSAPLKIVFDITDGVHRGVSGNFLHCLEFALSLNVRYVSQLDSDDILADPYFLLRQTSFLDSHPEAQAACSGFFLIDEKDTLETVRGKFHSSPLCNKSSVTQDTTANVNSKTISYTSTEESSQNSVHGIYRDLKITPETLLTNNNPLVAGGVTYRTEHLRVYLNTFASREDATQDLPLWLFLSQCGSFWGTDTQSIAYRNLAESVSRSEDLETQLRFQKESLDTRLRFTGFLKQNHPQSSLKRIDKLEDKAKLLYEKKMLRHYAKLSPKEYPAQLKQSLKKSPSLIFSKDIWRSIGVYLKNR
ncbi:MAG: glycosyltransferase family 2 protein [Bacteroidales bacterium]|nr:glycosyltransferase family 2 protein [Bacteroidales bacterium]